MTRSVLLGLSLAGLLALPAAAQEQETAIFAGGCFWSVESNFDKVPGVVSTISGYIGGETQNPTYENHKAGRHRQAVEITYDPGQVSYETLLASFFRSIDPTDDGGQFCDRNFAYTTAIYTLGDGQASEAQAAKEEAGSALNTRALATEILPATQFWPAEEYHQDFHVKNPAHYNAYRIGCGRDRQLQAVWGDEALRGIES